MTQNKIKLMAEYGGTVIWGVDANDIGPINPNSLPLKDELRAAIANWAETYDETLSEDSPADSGFASPSEQDAFEQEGIRLWKELQAALGNGWKVVYYSDRDRKFYE